MIARGCGLVLALLILPVGVMAADEGGAFAVKGVGLTKCSDFVTAARDKKPEQVSMYVGWVGGFITGSNLNKSATFDLTPWQNMRTLTSALMAFCDKNADMRFAEASVRMAAALNKDRLVSRSDLIPIQHEGNTHYVYEEALRRAQAVLAQRGLYTGEIDGKFGKGTRGALEAFQKENKLPESGLPDQQTLFTLFKSDPG
jgi:hypothetical protein